MKLRWLRPFVVLTAALIVCISNIVAKRPVLDSLLWLLGAVVLFFIIGSIGTWIIDRTMNGDISKKEPSEESVVEEKEDKESSEE